ncbi:tyrosine-type recombinase/integrase [Actinomycetota bacterium]
MRDHLDSFLAYLRIEKTASPVTVRDYRAELLRLIGFLESQGIGDIGSVDTSAIRRYFIHSKDSRDLAPSSMSKLIATVKSFFNYLEEDEITAKNPSRRIKVPKKAYRIPSVMTKREVDLILHSIGYAPLIYRKNAVRDRLVITILYYTGIRKSELLNLDWSDLNLSRTTMVIRSGKGNKDRIIPLHKNVVLLLDKYLDERLPLTLEALFTGSRGRRMCENSFINLLNLYLKISGLKKKGYTAHSFRHSFATHLIQSGADIFKVQSLLGHASLDSTRVYINFNSTQMAEAVARL